MMGRFGAARSERQSAVRLGGIAITRGTALALTLALGLFARGVRAQSPLAPQTAAPPPAPEAAAVQSAQPAAAGTLPWTTPTLPDASGTPPGFLNTADTRIRDQRAAPTKEEVAGLKELDEEVARFTKIGGSYRDTLAALLQREYLRKRYTQDQSYARQVHDEEELEDKARLSAIALFEKFVAKYPDDARYTPDAMFRLGEMYFERDAILQQQEMEAYMEARDKELAAGNEVGVEPTKHFDSTINLYRTLVKQFPEYTRLDGVYYLIGYCLNEMGESNEARLAWLNLVCANHYQYKGEAPPSELVEDPLAAKKKAHPALDLDAPAPGQPTNFEDPYGDCEPAVKDSKFFAETWLRIGEYHFDFDFGEHGLSRSISAYRKVLEQPDDRNYNLALYKVAWAYYRASRYPEAMEHFWKLVDWSDEERKKTGKGSELREEAIQYLGIGFAYDDWNENQVPDPNEGGSTGIARVQDSKLLPQDKAWTPDVYERLGYIYFDEAKYPEAVQVWQLALSRWPMATNAPAMQNMIARAYTRHNEGELAIEARAKLGNYAEASDWWEANKDHPVEQRQAEELAEDALINTAINHHQRAQQLRRTCVENQDLDLCKQAQAEYQLAALAYRGYIQHYPNNPQAYELQYNLADALYWSENYEEAAREYAAVRDSNLDDTYLSQAARLAVESLKQLVDQQAKAGTIVLRTEPPAASGTPPQVGPLAMPDLVQKLASAREMYLARIDEAHDTEHVRESYFYNNSLLLYLYGYWDFARDRFLITYDAHCKGANGDETGQIAWFNLRNMAVALDHSDEVRQLGKDLEVRQCTFTKDASALAAVDCTKLENKDKPRCLAGADITNLRYKDAVDIFTRAEAAQGDDQRKLYERAATELVKAVNDEPKHPQAPLALEKAAIALERTSRFESAARLYQRIVDEVGPRKGATPEEQAQFDAILGNAYFRLGYNANRFFDYDRAIENYKILADSDRFAKSTAPTAAEWREGALINAAKILEYQQQYDRAAQYYKRAADILRDANEKRAAYFRVAEMPFKLKQWPRALKEMKDFITRYQVDRDAGELLVEAYWRIAEIKRQAGPEKDYDPALRDVVTAFAKSGQQPGSYAAEHAAQAQFTLVDKGTEDFDKFGIQPGKPATLNAYVGGVKTQIENGAKTAKSKAEGYNTIPPYRRPNWTIAAFVRQGRIYEILARAVLNTPFVVPADLQAKMKGLPDYAKDDIKVQVEDAIHQLLDQQVRPIECLAVARYALASRAGRAGNIDDQYTRDATDRINAYGDERIAECVAQAAAQDPTFAAYAAGEFTRAPRGLNLDIPTSVAPPPVVK
ncbi:MAG TPA: tetratricopeptide repeat protein [Polyangiales bacterium]|nr:tetratricopeptide repeat protein [Polyangiales bacterium]